jgi:16S rRNA (guanine1207-N2)-methyltransferase
LNTAVYENVFGAPPAELVDVGANARQFSPLRPGAERLSALPPGALDGLAMLAPPGAVERRRALALALKALAPGANLVAMAPKDKGGSRIAGDLELLGAPFEESARRHHRICVARGPGDPEAIEAAIANGAPRFLADIGLWSQPGVFSWDRVDPGSALLMAHMPALTGAGADLGGGIGVLANAALASPAVSRLTLVDIDRRAIEASKRNVDDARARFLWADARAVDDLAALDFAIMNPPFHDAGADAKALGRAFVEKAAAMLRKGGALWMVANAHLPYEDALKAGFAKVEPIARADGFKVFRAVK